MYLKIVYAMSKEIEKPGAVGFNSAGSPITKERLLARVKSAKQMVKAGDYNNTGRSGKGG